MKAVQSDFIITSISSKKDGSLGLHICTPELTPQEKVVFLELQGQNITAVLSPKDVPEEDIQTVEKEIGSKTQAQRIRNVLYILFTQNNEGKTWQEFYTSRTESIIDWLKSKIDS